MPERVMRYYVPVDLDEYRTAAAANHAFVSHLTDALLAQRLEYLEITKALIDYALNIAANATHFPVCGLPPSIAEGLETPQEWYQRDIIGQQRGRSHRPQPEARTKK